MFKVILEIFWSSFATFRDFAQTWKIAPRAGESTKIEGWGDHKSCQNQQKTYRKQVEKMKWKSVKKWVQISVIWSLFGSQNGTKIA